jgi:hypothetical protein
MNLESDKRLNIQLRLDFSSMPTGEARQAGREDIESLSVVSEPERPANTSRIMEEICERANLKEALRQVRGNKGSAGADRMTVDQLGDYLKQHWLSIREQLLNGTYEPKPVRRVEIPKPDGGGVRKLGIPTVLDRFIQQAVMQVLQKQWNPTFSLYSYGFRPRRSAHQAVAQAQQYIAQGYGWVIDLDLEKFFDRVNHDKLMSQIAKRIEDKRLLKLIRAFLNAGVMENGLVSPSVEGTPQGGPLSRKSLVGDRCTHNAASGVPIRQQKREPRSQSARAGPLTGLPDPCCAELAVAIQGQRPLRSHPNAEAATAPSPEPLYLQFWNRSEVGWRNAVLCCCLVRRSDPKERRLRKRSSEEHDPERKLCRNGPHQARAIRSGGIADSVEHLRGETRRDGQCRKTVLSQQAPDRIRPAC